jgi:3-dehydrosphinganine reductase
MSVVVTGAGSGLGLQLARLLGERGEGVLAVDHSFEPDALEQLGVATGAPYRLVVAEADVSDGSAVAAAFSEGTKMLGAPWLVINCAGVDDAREFASLDEDDFRRVVEMNLIGSRNVAAAALDHIATPGGQLVLSASLAGLVPNYGWAADSASKSGVVGLAEVLRLELKPRGIRVSVICPPKDSGAEPADPAAAAILSGIDRGDFMIVPSPLAKGVVLLSRVAPRRLRNALSDWALARELRG